MFERGGEFYVYCGNFKEGNSTRYTFSTTPKERKFTESQYKLKYDNNGNISRGILIENELEYFVEMKEGKEVKRERTFTGIRMMVIGCESVGKSSFKKRLIASSDSKLNKVAWNQVKVERREEHMTHGVEIEFWKEKGKVFSLWDFAGK